MAGLIREEDIAQVRERAPIYDVVSPHVMLKPAGGGSYKGLCPFHDEKSPSFQITPARNFFHCFGCGEGGDVIKFVMKHDGLPFNEAVEWLAQRFNIELHYTEGHTKGERRETNLRPRLIEAHRVAAAYYAEQLASPDAMTGRTFLADRGFDRDAAERFGVGYAPRDGDALFKHLRQRGFTDDELVTGGLVAHGQRGHYDRFRGRLLWPIRNTAGETIGFGARRLFDDDRVEAKYLNTPETPIYKKSQVLYGVDLARKDIGSSSQAVVVEGYTDVMACHLAGVTTAVATCGTAFGEDHGRVLRRLLHDHEQFRGEIIFTFDGDEAGQKAALRAFGGDQQFVGQTYVAIEPEGLDPCDLRVTKGDEAVRELIARRVPLYRFVLGNVVRQFDLDRADGRVDALREAAKLVASIRDRSKVEAFARELAGMVGVEIEQARNEVRRAAGSGRGQAPASPPSGAASAIPGEAVPDPRDPRFTLERETLKVVVQRPDLVVSLAAGLGDNDFTHPTLRAVWRLVEKCGGAGAAPTPDTWAGTLLQAADDAAVEAALNLLAVEPLPTSSEKEAGFAAASIYRLQEVTVLRAIADLKSRLQRTNPVEEPTEYNRMFGDLVALEQKRRSLRELAIGETE